MKYTLLTLTGFASIATANLVPVSFGDAAPLEKRRNASWECPTGCLKEPYVKTSAIFPISKKNPDKKYGDSKKAKITPDDFCTIFNLFIPESAHNKTCTLEFLFPSHEDASTHYKFKGEGNFIFKGYTGYGGEPETTWNNQPPAGPPQFDPPPQNLKPGGKYVIHSGDCLVQEGQTGGLEVGGKLCSSDTRLEFEECDHDCPIGFFIEIS